MGKKISGNTVRFLRLQQISLEGKVRRGEARGEISIWGKKHNCRITENIKRKKEFLCLDILEKEKLHLLIQGDATASIFQLQGSCTKSYDYYSSYTETESSHSH